MVRAGHGWTYARVTRYKITVARRNTGIHISSFDYNFDLARQYPVALFLTVQHTWRVGGVDAFCDMLNWCRMYRASAHNRCAVADPTYQYMFHFRYLWLRNVHPRREPGTLLRIL